MVTELSDEPQPICYVTLQFRLLPLLLLLHRQWFHNLLPIQWHLRVLSLAAVQAALTVPNVLMATFQGITGNQACQPILSCVFLGLN
jgi:hypothetical protein